ncbi:hypothetical protein [Segatella copri]|uniref:hypothetical protein n=1 Tax=Segatella copri TaxID=165179 RepID=UPI001F352352|nr:hypothetical protein [Segatella copri]
MESKTKFILTYVAGIVTGCVLLFVIGCIINAKNSSAEKEDIVMFDSPRNAVPGKSFKVVQVLPDGNALARIDNVYDDNFGIVVLFLGDESTSYYDDQKIEIPKGKVAKQIGNYSYMSRMNIEKTVPVVKIMDE